MRTLIFLALVAVAVASRLQETHFKAGHEYQYQYEGQTLTGFPGASKKYSGLKVKCLVKLVFRQEDKVQMQMDDCQVGQLNKKLSSTQIPERQVSIREFEPIERQELELIQSELSKPCEFRYSRGQVEHFSYSSEEPEWSVDVKRAVVQIFQLNLNKQNVPYAERMINGNNIIRDWDQQQHTFRVKEDSINGECEQVYTVNSLPIYEKYSVIQPEVPVLNITKVKNFTTCDNFPILLNSTINFHNCTDCKSQKTQPLQSYAHTRYNCTGSRQQFLIESAETEGRHIFTPYEEKNGELTTYVRQSLKLVHTMPVRSHIPTLSSKKQSSLRMKSLDQHNHGEREQHQKRQQYIVQKCVSILEAMKEDVSRRQVVSSEAPSNVIHLIAHLRHAKPHEVEQIYQEVSQRSQPTLLKLFIDALPMLGSPVSVKIIKQEVQRERLSKAHIVQLLSQLSYTCNKVVNTVDEMMHLCMEPTIQRSLQLKSACWLSFGNMVHETCKTKQQQQPQQFSVYQQTEQQQQQSKCPEDKQETYRKVLAQGITSSKQSEQFICLSAIGNAGLQKSAQDLFYVIKDSSRPKEIRINALYALQRIAKKMPRQTEEFLLPVFMDTEEQYELRIGAVNVILSECRPQQEIVQTIVQQMAREPNTQVGSYVYSILNTIANTTQACHKRLSKDVQEVLRFARPIRPGMQFSKTMLLNLLPKQFRDELKMQPSLNVEMIGSNTSMIPRVLHASLQSTGMGKLINLMGVGVRTEGIHTIFKWLEQSGVQEWEQYFQRHPRNINAMLREVMQIKEQLQIEDRIREEPSLSMWLELFGTKLSMLNINKETINDIIDMDNVQQKLRELQRKVLEGIDLSFTKSLPLMYSEQAIPTEMGLPIKMHLSSAVVAKNHGYLKAETRESQHNKFLPSQIKIDLELKPSFAAQISGNMTVKLATVESGCSIKAKAKVFYPISGKFTLDLKRQTLEKEMQTPQQEHEILKLEVKPLTFIKRTPFTKFTSQSPVVPVHISEKFEEQTVQGLDIFRPNMNVYKYPVEILGTEFVVQTQQVPRVPGAPFHPITGKQFIKVYVKKLPQQQPVERVQLKLKYQSEKTETPFWSTIQTPSQQPQYQPQQQQQQQWYDISSLFSSGESQEQQYWNPSSSELDMFAEQSQPQQRYMSSESFDSQEEEQYNRQPTPIYSNKHVKRQITAQIESQTRQGEQIEKVVSALIWHQSQDYTKQKVQLKVVKSQQQQSRHQKVLDIEAEVQYPQLANTYTSWQELISNIVQQQESIKSQINIKWGQQGQKQIKIKSVTEKSPEQRWEQETGSYKQKPEFQQCEKDARRGNKHSPACRQIHKYLGQHRQVRIDIDYQQVPHYVKNVTSKLYRAVKAMLYSYADVNDLSVPQHNNNKISMIVKLMNNSHVVDVHVKSPSQITRFTRVPLPFTVEPMAHCTTSNMLKEYVNLYTNRGFNPKCRVVNQRLQTFDKVSMPFPSSECYHVLARDCSPQQEFTVLAATEQRTQLKKVQIFSLGQKIKISPRSESEQGMKVTVNEEQVEIRPGQKVHVGGSSRSSSEQQERCVINRLSHSQYKVECQQSGLQVNTDGHNIEIKVSEMQRGVQCGLCGDLNGEQLREFTGPRGQDRRGYREFVRSYVVPTPGQPQCQRGAESSSPFSSQQQEEQEDQDYFQQLPSESYWEQQEQQEQQQEGRSYYEQIFGQEPQEEEDFLRGSSEEQDQFPFRSSEQFGTPSEEFKTSSEEYSRYLPTSQEESRHFVSSSEQVSPVYMTRVEKSQDSNLQQVLCFSNKPVKTCPRHTRPLQSRQRRVSFHCVPRHSEEARQLLSEVEQQERRPVYKLEYKSKDETLSVPEDITCSQQ